MASADHFKAYFPSRSIIARKLMETNENRSPVIQHLSVYLEFWAGVRLVEAFTESPPVKAIISPPAWSCGYKKDCSRMSYSGAGICGGI